MFENKFFLLFINFLWMAGLFGTLFALIYMVQYRRRHWWNIGYTYNVPRLLAPLYGSLLIFVVGLALHAYAARRSISLWVALVWGVLALFFLFRLLDVIFAALQSGWDSVLVASQPEEGQRPSLPIWSSSVIALLLANLLLLGWWGSTQLNAGALDLSWMERGRATRKSGVQTPPTAMAQPATAKPAQNGQLSAQASAATPTVQVTLLATGTLAPIANTQFVTGTLVPAISTLDASALQVTPTPSGTLSSSLTAPVMGQVITATALSSPPSTPTLPSTPQSTATALVILAPTPTLTATVPTSLTVAPLPTASAGPLITVQSATGANVHAAPDLNANIVRLVADATVAPVLGRTADRQWFLIRLSSGAQGWISAQDVVFNGTVDLVPVAASK